MEKKITRRLKRILRKQAVHPSGLKPINWEQIGFHEMMRELDSISIMLNADPVASGKMTNEELLSEMRSFLERQRKENPFNVPQDITFI